MRFIRSSALLCLLLYAPVAAASGIEDNVITLIHRERALQPGEAVLFEAHSPHPLQHLHAEAFGHEFPAFSDQGGLIWTALVGIDLETKPGRYRIEFKGADENRKSLTAQKMLTVKAKTFPTRALTVEEKYVTPPAAVLSRIDEERARVEAIFAAVTPAKLWSGPFRAPLRGAVISAFGKRNVYNGKPRSPHSGVDYRGAVGTPIRSPNAGRVVLAANLYYSGNTIILDHGFGLYSYFGHLSEFSVTEGDQVETESIIGKVGATGRVTGPHLHWTVRLARTRIDPLSLISILQNRK